MIMRSDDIHLPPLRLLVEKTVLHGSKFSLATKIPVKSPLWLTEFCMIFMYNGVLKVKINLLYCLAFIVEWLNRIKKAAFSHLSFTDFCPILNNIKNLTLSTNGTRSSF